MTRAKILLSSFAAAAILGAMAIFLTAPARYAQSVLGGISLWATCVLPATFPFLFLTALLTGLPPFRHAERLLSPAMGKLFRVSGAGGCAALLAALSGYPVGARMIYDLRSGGMLAEGETFRLACLCSTSGPMFLVGTVGSLMYGSAAAGWALLAAHLSAVWAVCFVLRLFARPVPPRGLPPRRSDPALLYDSLYNAVISILCVGGFIALFSCFGQMLGDLGVLRLLAGGNGAAEGVWKGLLEMTTGCAVLAQYGTSLSLALSCAVVTFGGLCVLCQQATFLTRAGVRMLPFLGVKLLQAALAFGFAYLLGGLVF